MGSESQSATTTSTTTNNLAMDYSSTNGDGLQILDSIVVDPSDKVMIETINQQKAAFEVMMSNSTVQLGEMLTMGSEILKLADSQQIRLEGANYQILESGVRMLQDQMAAGKYVIDLVDLSANRTFDLADNVATRQADGLEQALALVGDVKTETTSELVKSVSAFMVIFGLGALYMITRNRE